MNHRPRRPGRPGLEDHFARILTDDYRQRWSLDNLGNALTVDERQRTLSRMLNEASRPSTPVVLDVGSGGSSMLPDLEESFRLSVDLLLSRLVEVRQDDNNALVNADAAELPLVNDSVGIAVMFTIMSSVLDRVTRKRIAGEIDRVLQPGGLVLWYDMRLPSPGNRGVRPVSRRALAEMFNGYEKTIQSITVIPPLSRWLVPRWPASYRLLSSIPALRSHNVAVLRKPT